MACLLEEINWSNRAMKLFPQVSILLLAFFAPLACGRRPQPLITPKPAPETEHSPNSRRSIDADGELPREDRAEIERPQAKEQPPKSREPAPEQGQTCIPDSKDVDAGVKVQESCSPTLPNPVATPTPRPSAGGDQIWTDPNSKRTYRYCSLPEDDGTIDGWGWEMDPQKGAKDSCKVR